MKEPPSPQPPASRERELRAVVDAVCLSVPGVRVAKQPRPEAFIGPHGLEGDRHAREANRFGQPNLRQWTAVSTEEVAELCAGMGIDPTFAGGSLGENLRLSGIRLAEVPPQTVLQFPSGARLLVLGQNDPCVNAARELSETYGPAGQDFVKQAFGRRGIVGTVLETGAVRPGDEVVVLLPESVQTQI
jgi:MOSC domain-containing protein YiiM